MESPMVLNSTQVQKLFKEISEKYGSQACDLEPLHAMLFYIAEEQVKQCLQEEWCDDFQRRLRACYDDARPNQ